MFHRKNLVHRENRGLKAIGLGPNFDTLGLWDFSE